MKYHGKLFGALFGALFGGQIGLVFGLILGHLYDLGYFHHLRQAAQGNVHTQAQRIFFESTFSTMGYIAKSDGRVSENEIRAAKDIMTRMGLNHRMKQEAIDFFNKGKASGFSLDNTLHDLHEACHMQPTLLQIFYEIQYQMATADGHITPSKQSTLQYIAQQLGVQGFKQSYQQQYRYQERPSHQSTSSDSLTEAYQLLGVSKNATKEEVKKAYRKQMSQNHPDKLIAKGLPPEMIKVATQKTQRIKKAYELIKQRKGF